MLGDPQVLHLIPGELVRVRSAQEIFSTLDQLGMLDKLPFMPEMLRYCGRTFSVFKRADKTCDGSSALRRMRDVVHLSDIRCDGSAHGGCQAACLMYWKEAWLERRHDRRSQIDVADVDAREQSYLSEHHVLVTTRGNSGTAADPVYRCQATQIPEAATRLHGWEIDQYRRDMRNWGLWKIARGLGIEAFNRFQRLSSRYLPRLVVFHGGQSYPFVNGRLDKSQTVAAKLDLQPGDLVRIKSKEEIVKTLDRSNHNGGLSFDVEMLRYCGRTARVKARVERVIDEQSGRMIKIRRDCIMLEGVVCTSDYHRFCTRSTYPYWREAWLERVS